MRTSTLLLALVMMVMSAHPSLSQPSFMSDDQWGTTAKVFITHVSEGRFDEAIDMLDETMRDRFDRTSMNETWGGVTAQVGDFESIPASLVEVDGQYHGVDLTCEFERGELIVRVVLNDELKVAGLWFRPVEAPPYEAPDYIDEDSFSEEEVGIKSDDVTLPGTLTIPNGEGPFAGVVLVHGSGPHDRDETIGPNRPFKDLAWGLATRGVAVIRYDKRTFRGQIENAETMTVKEEVLDDATKAAELLLADARIDRVFVLGHSLGGVLAPTIAKRSDYLAGIIMMAATARSLDEVMSDQLVYIRSLYPDLPEERHVEFDSILADLTKLRRGTLPEGEKILGAGAEYFADLKAKRPVEQAKKLDMPILILQGERDYQATMVDYRLWYSAIGENPNVTMNSYAVLNHLFMEGEGKSTPEEYQNVGHVSEKVIDDMAAWMLENHIEEKPEPAPQTEQPAEP